MPSNPIKVSAIAALGRQRQIGKRNELLWNITADLERFKKLTTGKAVIMGRKTWESLPESVRPLPGRENIVLTRDKAYEAPGGVIKHDIDEAIDYAKRWSKKNGQDEIFIIGGANIYKQSLPQSDKLYLTLIDSDKEGDAFFPKYEDNFTETKRETKAEDSLEYAFVTLERR